MFHVINLLLIIALQCDLFCHAFDVVVLSPRRKLALRRHRVPAVVVFMSPESSSSSDPSSSSNFQQSRLFGNQRQPTVDEIQVMDEMIMKLADAKPYDLPLSVQRAYRVISSPQFFVRIAELADQYSDDSDDKIKLITLADNLVSTLDAVVSTAQDKMQEYTREVEGVIKAAAEPDSGEFLVPLSIERMNAMRTAMNAIDTSSLDGDTFLSTIDAYMNKSHQDGLDLMVGILQNVLQLYAGRRVYEARQRVTDAVGNRNSEVTTTTAAGELFDVLLQTDSDRWDSAIRNGLIASKTSSLDATTDDGSTTTTTSSSSSSPMSIGEELIAEIQKNMESIILSQLESGSMAQRVQAEYLQELVKRIEHVQQQQQL